MNGVRKRGYSGVLVARAKSRTSLYVPVALAPRALL